VRILAYTSPARGHLNPMMGPLLELRRRGAEVHVRTLSSQVEAVRAAGLECEPLAAAIEALPHNDHRARNQIDSGRRSFATLAARAPLEVADFEAALGATDPDVVLVDTTTYGAKAVAERLGLRWAEARPFLFEEPAPGVPPFGLGLRPKAGAAGRLRDASLGLVGRLFDRKARLPAVNAGRQAAGLPPLASVAESRNRGTLTLYFTAEPFEYARPLPANVVMVGPGEWDTAADADAPVELPDDDRPLALVACSSEFQDDGAIAATALAGLRQDWRLVITTAGVDPAQLGGDHGDAVVARFLPHGPLLQRADVVVCHGGMGVTQKALAAGVPVCVVPWGRDQLEVAAHVVEARAGTRISRRRLNSERLAVAVARAQGRRDGAARVRAGFEATGGSATAATALESLVPAPAP
jgi:MGT family glycosyltransferase